MEETRTTFDIRQLTECNNGNEIVQAGYTITNRMAALLGDINFHDIYTTLFSDLIHRLAQNIDAAPQQFRDPERVKSNHAVLSDDAGDYSFLTLYQSGYAAIPATVQTALLMLLTQDGIYWPILTGKASHDRGMLQGMEELIIRAGHLTYRDFYELAYNAPEVTPDVIAGVRAGFDSNCIFGKENLCCPAMMPPPACNCAPSAAGSCSCSADGSNYSLASSIIGSTGCD